MSLLYLIMLKIIYLMKEPFGPIVPILTFKDFDEVMDRANNNDLGLCSYVYTTDLKKQIKHQNN